MQIYREIKGLFLCPVVAIVLSFLLLYNQKLHSHLFCNSNRPSGIVPHPLP